MNARFLIGSFFVGLLACAPAYADVTIGFVEPMTGKYAVLGEQLKRGTDQAVKDINAAGGINGEKIVLHPGDDACDPKQAVSAANEMASAGIKFVVGHVCSGSAIPASKVYMEEGMLLISPGASNPKLTDEAKDLIFRTFGRDDNEGAVLGQYIAKHFRNQKIAIIQDNSAYGYGMAEAVKKILNGRGVNEVLFEGYTPGERDYSALISKLKQAGVEVLIIGGYHTEAGLIARQIKEQGVNIQIVGGNALVTDEFWSIAGPAGEGTLISFTSDPRKVPQAKNIIEEMRKSGYEPEGYTLFSYAAVQIMAEGIKRAGKTDPMKVAAALRSAPVQTILGPLSFDAKGDVSGVEYAIYRWHDGKYTEVGN